MSNGVASSSAGDSISTTASGNTISINQPSLISTTITTNPAGRQILVDGATYTAPQTFQWTPGSQHTLSTPSPQNGAPGVRYIFANWSDGGTLSHTITTPSSSTTFTVNLTTQYQLTTSVSPSGSGSIQAAPASGSGYYNSGTTVQLTANASSGKQFSSWSGDAGGSANPVTVQMNSPRSVTASFTDSPQGITITTNPAGRQILVDGATYTAPQTFQWTPGSQHTLSTPSPQLGFAGARYLFSNWSDGGSQSHTITTPASNTTFTATFTTQYQLTTSVSPAGSGSIQVAPPSADGYYNSGATVQLTANPASGKQFLSWSGDVSDSDNPAIVAITGLTSVTALFTDSPQGITISSNPAGRQILVDGATYTAPQTFQWTPGSQHTVSAVSPQSVAGARYLFASWSDGGSQSHTITTPASNTTFTATFTTQYQLTTSVSPAGTGSVQLVPFVADGYYDSGTVVELRANPSSGATFGFWSGDLTGASNPDNIFMGGPRTVTANFSAPTAGDCSYTLSRTSFSASNQGDIGRIQVATNDNCSWNSSSNSPWVSLLSGTSGTGQGYVKFLVAANPSNTTRTAHLTIGGQDFAVLQSGSTCGVSTVLQSPSSILSVAGGITYLNLITDGACQWAASAAPGWISLPTASGSNSAALPFTVPPNAGSIARAGSVSVDGQVVPFLQRASGQQVFFDVPDTHPFADYVNLLQSTSVTSGCNAVDYCPESITTRGQMAVLIIRSMYGSNFAYTQTPYFTDVPPDHPFFKYIQKMRDLQITTGCSASQYCPDDNVTRGQMAAFLVRAKLGLVGWEPFPFPSAQIFADVPSTDLFYPYVQKMRQLGITSGCSATAYCPNDPTTRGQMAVFLIRAFFVP